MLDFTYKQSLGTPYLCTYVHGYLFMQLVSTSSSFHWFCHLVCQRHTLDSFKNILVFQLFTPHTSAFGFVFLIVIVQPPNSFLFLHLVMSHLLSRSLYPILSRWWILRMPLTWHTSLWGCRIRRSRLPGRLLFLCAPRSSLVLLPFLPFRIRVPMALLHLDAPLIFGVASTPLHTVPFRRRHLLSPIVRTHLIRRRRRVHLHLRALRGSRLSLPAPWSPLLLRFLRNRLSHTHRVSSAFA
jgi:hypothetical protein